MCNSLKFFIVPQAIPTALAPLSSALFLAIAKTSRLGAPFYKAWAIVSTPSGPNPQLLIKNFFKEAAWLRYLEKAIAPKGLTALSERSISMTFLPIKLSPKNPKLSGISSFNLPTNMFYKSISLGSLRVFNTSENS